MNLIKELKTWILLWHYSRIVKKYDKKNYPIRAIKTSKRKIQFLKIKINDKLSGLIITSQSGTTKDITRIEFIWANPTLYIREKEIYQNMFEIFMQWQHLFLTPISVNNYEEKIIEHKVTLVLDISSEAQIEKFRRVLTLYGFYPDAGITMSNLEFKKPWRDKEVINNIVYSRML